jgi:hypothetical protein
MNRLAVETAEEVSRFGAVGQNELQSALKLSQAVQDAFRLE